MYHSVGNDGKSLENMFIRHAHRRPDFGNLDMTCWHFDDFSQV